MKAGTRQGPSGAAAALCALSHQMLHHSRRENSLGFFPLIPSTAHGWEEPGEKLRVQGEWEGKINFVAELWHLVGSTVRRG